MRFVIQRVSSASVTIDGKVSGEIGKGFVVLIGIGEDDTKEIADKLLHKLLNMRIFEDENGKTNLALKDVSGELLMISQFTLYANCKKGNRPSFTDAGRPATFPSITGTPPASSSGWGTVKLTRIKRAITATCTNSAPSAPTNSPFFLLSSIIVSFFSS